MKSTIRFILVVCVIALMSANFRSSQAAPTLPAVIKMPAQIAGGRPVTISIPDKPPSSNDAGLKVWTDQVGRFMKAYPNVTINGLEYAYDTATFAALIAGKQVPTLMRVYLTDPQIYINLGIAADLTKIIDANNLRKVVNPNLLNLGIKDDKVYAFPKAAYAMGLGYNIPMLKAAGIAAPPANRPTSSRPPATPNTRRVSARARPWMRSTSSSNCAGPMTFCRTIPSTGVTTAYRWELARRPWS